VTTKKDQGLAAQQPCVNREEETAKLAVQRPVCLIHIGYHRTGTSFLQTALFPLIPDSVFSQHLNVVSSSETSRLTIVSNESLSSDLHPDKPELAAILARQLPNARILIGIRSQYSIMRGIYHLHIKGGGTEDYESFVKARCGLLFDYAGMVDAYRAAFGVDNVFVLPHEDLSRDPLGSMAALLRFVGTDPGIAKRVVNVRVKPSAEDPTLALLRVRNRLIAPLLRLWPRAHEKITAFGLPGARLLNSAIGKGLRLPTNRVRPAIRNTYADGNARLFASLGLKVADYDYPFPDRP
jgi:hypothetical protein